MTIKNSYAYFYSKLYFYNYLTKLNKTYNSDFNYASKTQLHMQTIKEYSYFYAIINRKKNL